MRIRVDASVAWRTIARTGWNWPSDKKGNQGRITMEQEQERDQQPSRGDRLWMVREIDAKRRRRQRGRQRFFYASSAEQAEAKFAAVQQPLHGNILICRPEQWIFDGRQWLCYRKSVAERIRAAIESCS